MSITNIETGRVILGLPAAFFEDKVFMFIWAIVAGVTAFVAQQIAQRLASRRRAHLTVLTTTQSQTLERMIVSIEQAYQRVSQMLKLVKNYGEKLELYHKELCSDSRTPESQARADELRKLEQSTLDAVYKPTPSNLFLPPEFTKLIQDIEMDAGVEWVLLSSSPEKIRESIVAIDKSLQRLEDTANRARTQLWQRLRDVWRRAKMPDLLTPLELQEPSSQEPG